MEGKFQLLYRASRDGFPNFWKKCNKKGRTVSIILSKEFGHVFGGYVGAKWDYGETWNDIQDDTAFIFALRVSKRIAEKYKKEESDLEFPRIFEHIKDGSCAIQALDDYGPVFGEGNDFALPLGCDESEKAWSAFPRSFWKNAYNTATDILAGDSRFYVKDYEVYEIL